MTAPFLDSTDKVKAAIKRVSHNKGRGDNEGPSSIGGGSASNMTTCTEGVEPHSEYGDTAGKRSI